MSNIRWMVTDDGQVYIWSPRQAERLKSETDNVLNGTHFDILSIITENPVVGKKGRDESPIIAMGMLDYGTPALTSLTLIPGPPQEFKFREYLQLFLGTK